MIRYVLIVLVLLMVSCSTNNTISTNIPDCTDLNEFYFEKEFSDSLAYFNINIPENWICKFTGEKNHKTFTFGDTSLLENYEIISISQGDKYQGFSFEETIQEVLSNIKMDRSKKFKDSFSKDLNGIKAYWIFTDDISFNEPTPTFSIFTISEKNYFWITSSLIDSKDFNTRKCKLLSIINSFQPT